jgi:serine/threonine protein phosphatase PrpC
MTAATWASTSSRGGRPDNQDCLGDAEAGGTHGFVVADGLGGHAGGARASASAVDAILASLRADPRLHPETLRRQFAAAQEALHGVQRGDPNLAGCRTTATVLLVGAGRALWGHVGDTRLYHLRDGRIVSRTLDHSVPQALVYAGEITPDAIRAHPDRNRLLRALGGEDPCEPTLPDGPVPAPGGDVFLLCTDGFWEWILEEDMEATLGEVSDPAAWIERMEKLLLERATGAYDNYTATAVFVGGARRPAGRRAWLVGGLVAALAALVWLLIAA